MELPKIISVDDHVVEPAHVWQTWLPEKYREKGPHVERKRWGKFRLKKGAKYEMTEDPEGEWGDAWIYEDKVIYVQKKFVAIPKSATKGDDVSTFDKTVMTMTAVTYDDMRAGCWDAKERKKDFEVNWVDGSLPFPTFPRFCGQTFMEADDRELALACVKAYNDWMVDEWCDPSIGINIPLCIIPLWDPQLAAQEIQRNAARGVRAVCFSELPTRLDLPSIHTGHWDPMFDVCDDTGTTVCMHVGSSSTDPFSSRDAPPGVGSMVSFNNSMASLGDYLFGGIMHRFPKLKIAYSRRPDRLAAVRARARRHGVAGAQRLAELQAPVPRAAFDLLLRPRVRLLHLGPARRELAPRSRREQHLLRDRLPAHRHDVAQLEGLLREDARGHDRRTQVQDPARQRDPHARARPRLTRPGLSTRKGRVHAVRVFAVQLR